MAEMTARTPTRLAPAVAWTVVTDAPLRGLALAREAGRILAWDETDTLTLHDADGSTRATARAPGRIIAGPWCSANGATGRARCRASFRSGPSPPA